MRPVWKRKSEILHHRKVCYACGKVFYCTLRQTKDWNCSKGRVHCHCVCPECMLPSIFNLRSFRHCFNIGKKDLALFMLIDKLKMRRNQNE